MQWLLRLLLSRSFFEARALASQAKFNDVLRVHVLGAIFDDPLHVAALCPDESPRHLELFVVRNLDVKAAGVLYGLVVYIRSEVLVLRLIKGRVLRHHKRFRYELASRMEHVLRLKNCRSMLLLWWVVKRELGFGLLRLAVKRRVFLLFLLLRFRFRFWSRAV